MTDATAPRLRTSVVIVTYNAGAALTRCLDSLATQNDGEVEVIVVNSGEAGAELEDARRRLFVRLVEPGVNLGYAGGSNLGAAHADGDVLVFLNPDTVVAPGALAALVEPLADPSIAIATARLRLLDQPELLNSAGNVVHITGIGWAGSYGEPAETVSELRDVAYPSGSAMAICAERFHELGRFTERLFMYHEDLELGWRARLHGLRVVVAPKADIYHDYDYGRNARKSYLLERNRLVFVLSAYSGRLLAALAPLLVTTEAAMALLAAREGWLRDKVAGWSWCARNAGWLREHRRQTQRLRRVRDRELADVLTPVLSPRMIRLPAVARAANPVMTAYWSLARRFL